MTSLNSKLDLASILARVRGETVIHKKVVYAKQEIEAASIVLNRLLKLTAASEVDNCRIKTKLIVSEEL